MILQNELIAWKEGTDKLKKTRDKMRLVEAALDDSELSLIKKLEEGETIEKGKVSARVNNVLGRASVQWKIIVEELKGKAFVEKTLAGAERPITKKLEVIL